MASLDQLSDSLLHECLHEIYPSCRKRQTAKKTWMKKKVFFLDLPDEGNVRKEFQKNLWTKATELVFLSLHQFSKWTGKNSANACRMNHLPRVRKSSLWKLKVKIFTRLKWGTTFLTTSVHLIFQNPVIWLKKLKNWVSSLSKEVNIYQWLLFCRNSSLSNIVKMLWSFLLLRFEISMNS